MSAKFNFDDVTLVTTELEKNVNSILLEQFQSDDARIKSLFSIKGGYNGPTQKLTYGKVPYTGQKVTSCSKVDSNFEVPISERIVSPVSIGTRLFICAHPDVDQMFAPFYETISKDSDKYNLASGNAGAIVEKMTSLVKGSLQESIIRGLVFGKKNVIASTGSLPGLKDAANIPFYDPFNGLIEQVTTDSSYKSITASSFTSYIALCQAIINQSDDLLYERWDAQFYMDRTSYMGLIQELKDLNRFNDLSYTQGLGLSFLFDGRKVNLISDVLKYGNDFEVNNVGHAALLPTKIYYTTPNNLEFSTVNAEDPFELIVTEYSESGRGAYADVVNNVHKEGYLLTYNYAADLYINSKKLFTYSFGQIGS